MLVQVIIMEQNLECVKRNFQNFIKK